MRSIKVSALRLLAALVFSAVLVCPAVAWADDFAATIGPDRVQVQAGSDLSSATSIALNKETKGKLASSNDKHWYKVTLPSAGRFQVTFGGDYSANGGAWEVALKDASNEQVWLHSHWASDLTSEAFGVTGLPAGTYYLVVDGGYSVIGLTYSLTPQFQASSAWETEFNDRLQSADAVGVGAEVVGSKRSGGDVDWYKVTLPSAGRFQVSFGADYNPSGGTWYVSLRDSVNDELWERSHSARELTSETFGVTGLPAGTYYLRVSGGDIGETYSLTPQFQASSAWETEFNDTVVTANQLALGSKVYGTTRSGGDEDWFKIEVPKKGKFQISFDADYAAESYSWSVSLRDWRNNEIMSNSYYANTKSAKRFVTPGKLDVGTYYIKVTGDTNRLTYNFVAGYYVPSTKIVALKSLKKGFKVKWTKKSGASRYQIRYSTKTSMAKAKTVTASKKSNAKKVKKLKGKKRYYVQVRTVKKIAGKEYYSSWSKKQSVKTRK